MNSRRLLTVVVLLAWVLLGPIAFALESCDGMGTMCEGLCGSTVCLALTPSSPAFSLSAGQLWVKAPDNLKTTVLKVHEPPPKSVRLSA